MRPVDKGREPDINFKKYQDAELFLEERLGAYCSFCELPIIHVPEVEHKEAKAEGGDELNWNNLLLSCKYCNTRKGVVVKKCEKQRYLWLDEDDTFHPFLYDTSIPSLNRKYLAGQDTEIKEKAENLFMLVKLNHFLISPKDKDRRYRERNEARNCALESKAGWDKVKDTVYRELYLKQIIMLAKSKGFFSTWMNVFSDDLGIKSVLRETFKGTKEVYCND